MLDRALYVGRHHFGSVNPEIRMIEGQISEVLLYIVIYVGTVPVHCLISACMFFPYEVTEQLIFIFYRTCLLTIMYDTLCWIDLFINFGKSCKLISRTYLVILVTVFIFMFYNILAISPTICVVSMLTDDIESDLL